MEDGLNLSARGRAWRGEGWRHVHVWLWLSPVAVTQLEVLRHRRVPVPASLARSIRLYEQACSQLGFPHSSLPKPHWLLGSAFFRQRVAGNAHLCVPGAPQ